MTSPDRPVDSRCAKSGWVEDLEHQGVPQIADAGGHLDVSAILALLRGLLPRHLLANLVRGLTESRHPLVKQALLRHFLKRHAVDLSQAEFSAASAYASFNAFFTRRLRPDARPLCPGESSLVSPVDGRIVEYGDISAGRLIQAKGRRFYLSDLLGSAHARYQRFLGGRFVTLYLSPADYHRVHMPFDGRLRRSRYIPGRLFSVDAPSRRAIANLYARNERLICEFESAAGPFILVLVGAGFVAGLETRWSGRIERRGRRPWELDHSEQALAYAKGEELACFHLGSTVILLLPADTAQWEDALQTLAQCRVGQRIATFQELEVLSA